MNIEQLQYICMVAKTNSITIAAENLYVTQQTVSKAINKLENELGVVLMIRSHKGVQLTEVGETFVEKARVIVRDFQDLYDTTCVSSSEISGQVKIYQSTYISQIIGAKFLLTAQRKYPKLSINIEEKLTAEMIESVKNSEGEIALIQTVNQNCGAGKLSDYADFLEWEPIFHDTLVACVANNNALAKKESISIKQLMKNPIVWGNCFHMEEILQEEYDISVNVLLNSSNMALQKSIVMDGAAVTLATEFIVHDSNFDTSGFKIIPIKETMRLETFLIKPKGYKLTKQQEVVVEEVKRALQRV